MISSLPRTLVPTKKPSGAARLPRRVFSVSPVAATGSGRKKSQTFPPPPDAGSGIPPSHRVQDGRRVLVADGLNAADGVPPAFCAAAQGCGWPNTGQRALPLPPPTYAAAGKMIPPPAWYAPPERPPAPPVPPDQTAAPAPGDEPTNLSLSIWPGQPAAASPPDGHRPRGSENSPQCGRCGHGCCTLYRVWTPARPPRPTGPVSPVRCPRGWPAAPPVPRCSKPDSPPPSARSPARSPFHSQGNPIHSSRRPSAAPKSISLKVGWGWITADRSSAVRPF